jgi:Trypsin
MMSLRRVALSAATAAACAFTLSVPALAINTYNAKPAPERTEVGSLVAQYDRDGDPSTPDAVRWVCSGTMISDTVFLTAAHCTTDWPEGTRLGVSLAQNTQDEIDTAAETESTPRGVFNAVAVEGTPHSDPAYPGPASNPHDIAVLTFDGAEQPGDRWDFEAATLPTAGQLSDLRPRERNALDYMVVGYGTNEAARGPGGHTHPGGGVRMEAPLGFDSLTKSWLKLDMHATHGNGGACYGDSGGPNFGRIDGQLVLLGTTITGDTPCYATNVTYRMDTPSARSFLRDQGVTLP